MSKRIVNGYYPCAVCDHVNRPGDGDHRTIYQDPKDGSYLCAHCAVSITETSSFTPLDEQETKGKLHARYNKVVQTRLTSNPSMHNYWQYLLDTDEEDIK